MTIDAEQLVDRLERLAATSAGAVRAAVYADLEAGGADVPALVRAARERQTGELQAGLDQAVARRRLLQDRVGTATLTPTQLERITRQLAQADLTVAAQRKAAARVLRRLEARPAPEAHSAPTAERLRHAGGEALVRTAEPGGQPLSAPRYELAWAADRYGVTLTAEEYAGAARLREAWARRQVSPKGVDMGGGGRSVPGPRLPMSDRQLAAGRAWNAIWHRLPAGVRPVVVNFICEEAPPGRDSPLTAVEFGQLYGQCRERHMAKGVSIGALKATCALIAALWREYDGWKARRTAR